VLITLVPSAVNTASTVESCPPCGGWFDPARRRHRPRAHPPAGTREGWDSCLATTGCFTPTESHADRTADLPSTRDGTCLPELYLVSEPAGYNPPATMKAGPPGA